VHTGREVGGEGGRAEFGQGTDRKAPQKGMLVVSTNPTPGNHNHKSITFMEAGVWGQAVVVVHLPGVGTPEQTHEQAGAQAR
jgi:hypothetical protein